MTSKGEGEEEQEEEEGRQKVEMITR